MQQYVVPQFIDVEDKIIGPITTRQFLIMMATMFGVIISYSIADFSLFLVLATFELSFGGVFAFLRVNGRPFHYFILNVIQTMKRPSLRVWMKAFDPNIGTTHDITVVKKPVYAAHQSPEEKIRAIHDKPELKRLSLVVDTGGTYSTEDEVS